VLILNPVQLALKEVEARPTIVHEAPSRSAATQPTIMWVRLAHRAQGHRGGCSSAQGYLVVRRETGVEAMRSCRQWCRRMPVDIEMPRRTAFDLTRNVRPTRVLPGWR